MEVEVNISKPELSEHLHHVWNGIDKGGFPWGIVNVALWGLISFVYLTFFGPIDRSHIVMFFTVIICSGGIEYFNKKRIRTRIINREFELAAAEFKLAFDNDGIHSDSRFGSGRLNWSAVSEIDETENLIRLFTGAYDAILIPKRCVENTDVFRKHIEELRNAA